MKKKHYISDPVLTISEDKYRQIFENANEAIFLDQNGTIIFANNKFYHIFDFEKSELTDISWLDFFKPEDRKRLYPRKNLPVRNQGGSEYQTLRISTNSGLEKWIEINQVILDWEDKPAILNFVRDITLQKRLENRLQIAQKMEAIGTLAGGIAHDFNNILSPIIGYTELVLDEINHNSLAFKNLTQVNKAAHRARDLVQQILAFSRQSEKTPKPIMIQYVVNEALKLLRASIPSTVEFKTEINKNCPPVMADPSQIHQIVINLCSNAYHAMKKSGGVISIKVSDVDISDEDALHFGDIKQGNYIRLTVNDTGHGMDRKLVQRIFEPFFTTKEKGLGTGMGLSVVHGIVRDHNGYVDVYSEPNQGTTFHVYLPIIKSEEIIFESKKVDQVPRGHEHILLVDDEKAIVYMIKQMLESLGYQVTARTSSIEAFKAFENQPDKFDLVLTDQIMPNMTGELLARQISNIRIDIPIILCTGFSEFMDKEKLRLSGIDEVVLKPVLKSELALAIRTVIKHSKKKN
jgi:PAS domain S-box-containing protein